MRSLSETLRRMAYARRNTPHVVANSAKVEAVLIREAEYLEEAAEMLEAQEPVVLELSEIHRGVAVWLGDVDKADVILAIGGSSAGGTKCFITENDISIAPLDADYNVRWRAWTAEPTEEQREATPWN